MRVGLPAPIGGKMGEEFERVFDRLLAPRLFTEPFVPPFPYETAEAPWVPMMDVVETPAEYFVRLEIPGIHRENLDLNLTGDLLTITGRKEAAREIENEGYLVRERATGKFVRTIRLPKPVAEKKVQAEYRDGVLEVRLAKETPAPATKILIK